MNSRHRHTFLVCSTLLLLIPLRRSAFAQDRQAQQQLLDRNLIAAVKADDTNAVLSLLKQGADVNVRDASSEPRPHAYLPSALMLAVLNTPINAVSPAHLALIQTLLEHGANPNVAYYSNMNALSFAEKYGKVEIAKLLRAHGARLPDEILSSTLRSVDPTDLASITEITWEQLPGWAAARFHVTLRKDGAATYIISTLGGMNGTYQAKIPPADYESVARRVLEADFIHLEPAGNVGLDSTTLTISIVESGKRTTVEATGNDWTQGLMRLESLMERIRRDLPWKRVSQNTRWIRHLPDKEDLTPSHPSGQKKS